MKILPREKLILFSEFSIEELVNKLSYNVRPKDKKDFNNIFSLEKFGGFKTEPFEGYVYNKSFIINRVATYGNPFPPEILGVFSEDEFLIGTEIQIDIQQSRFAKVFLAIWFGSLSLIFFANLIFVNTKQSAQSWLSPLILIIAGFVLLKYFLIKDHNLSREEIIVLLNSKIKTAANRR